MEAVLQKKSTLFYLLLGLFVGLNAVFIWQEFFWLSAMPILIGVLLLALLSLDKFIMLIAFLTPLSLPLEEVDLGAALSLPSEPMIITAMMIFIAKCLIEGNYDRRILKHPVSIAISISLLWMFYTSVTSEIPLVSIKALISRFWFVSTFYFLGVEVFRRFENIQKFIWAHLFGLLIIIIYTTYVHSTWGFEKDPAHWVMNPFYHDHTAYGMIIALFLPVLFVITFNNRFGLFVKILILAVLVVYVIGFRLSNSRAAWVSIVGAIGVFFLFYFRIKWYVVLIASVAGILLFINIQEQLLINLGRNKQDSSENLEEHIQSISNITTDASNLERLNRWNCAVKMFEDRPWFGYGPGTYKFVYARYQRAKDKTVITTNAGNRGTAHSEYLLPLSEQGFLGTFWVIVIIITIIYTASKIYNSRADKITKRIALSLLLGFVTYWIHGLLNNFLELDKAGVPYWAFAGILVAMDLYHSNKPTPELKEI